MVNLPGWLLRVFAGLVVAGLLSPLTLTMPDRWQGPGVLVVLTGLCLVAAFGVRRRPDPRR